MKPFAGAWPTMITPFNADLQIDRAAYAEMIRWYLSNGVGGLYANCLSSEMYHLSPAERLQLAADAVQLANGQVPVAATGNFGDTLAEHVRSAHSIAATGVDVVMLVVPPFLTAEQEVEDYFLAMAEQVDAPLGIYECPVPRPYHLSVETVEKLAHTGRFVAFKETSCDWPKIQRLLAVTQGTPLALLQANTPYLLDAIRAGAPGTMSIATIWLPDLVSAVIRAAQNQDPQAAELQARLCALELAQRAVHPAGSKYLLAKRGLPIAPRLRANPQPLPPEVIYALDCAAAFWF